MPGLVPFARRFASPQPDDPGPDEHRDDTDADARHGHDPRLIRDCLRRRQEDDHREPDSEEGDGESSTTLHTHPVRAAWLFEK